jgi:hypothetical protein
MANTFKGYSIDLTATADTTVYTCPAATVAIVVHCQVANVDGTNAANVNVDLYDSSATTTAAVVSTVSVPADSALNPVGGKLVLEAGDTLNAWGSDADDLEMTLGILEIS